MSRTLRLTLYAFLGVAVLSAGLVLVGRRVAAGREAPRVIYATPAVELAVYVSGAVRSPGVYTLAEGARVVDALLAAGGASEDADLDRVNQAVRLRDEMQVHVPRKGEPAGAPPLGVGTPAPSGALLDLNAASAAELERLPGIGPVTSARIIDYRTRNGPFKTVEQLRDQKLVPASTFEKIKDRLTVQ